MSRISTLHACRVSRGKRYLIKEEFYALTQAERCEAVLWLFWPHEVAAKIIRIVARVRYHAGTPLQVLLKDKRAVHTTRYGYWRFLPGDDK